MIYHIIAFALGFILDMIIGDPYCLPHPVRAIGKMIDMISSYHLDKKEADEKKKRILGRLLVITVCLVTMTATATILIIGYLIHPYVGVVVESVMSYQIMAAKSLKVESMNVYRALKHDTIENARRSVSMIVGRDTDELSENEVTKACVETVAENTSDGVIAPCMYLFIGGPVLGMLYKAINTMDSMVGYKNDKYIDYGRAAAKTDDIVNYVPARISAYLMIISACVLGKDYNAKNAYKIYKRDRYNHASPNSAHTEAASAGALSVRLAGDAKYFGKTVKKPYIGDDIRCIEPEDILRVNKLMYTSAIIWEVVLCMAGISITMI